MSDTGKKVRYRKNLCAGDGTVKEEETMAYMRLGDVLVSAGIITEEQLQQALDAQKGTKKRLGQVLLEEGIISERQLIETLEIQLGIEFIDLGRIQIPMEMAHVLPRTIARRHNVVPVRIAKGELVLAMSDPLDYVAVEDVRSATRRRIRVGIATAAAVQRAIAALYGSEGATRAIEEMRGEAGLQELAAANESTEEDIQAAPTVRLVNSMIDRAVAEHASDIHLEPRSGEIVVRMRIDGMLRSILTIPKELQAPVIARLKVMGGMNVSERRVPQDGRASVRVRGRDIDLRLSTLPTIYGEKVAVRLFDKSAQLLTAEAIGLSGDNLDRYKALLANATGMVLIVGPTGSGKSSTMYTMIRSLNKEEYNLVTLEDPVEYDIDGVNQVQINEKTGLTFANGLRSVLRQDPDIIAVGEIRDGETAEIAMRSAMTGHLVLSTVHTGDAISVIDRLVDIGVAPYIIAEALNGIISQRLVRCICPDCREAYDPTDAELASLHMQRKPGMKFYRGRGCPNCYHTGYRGRTAVFEILMLDRALKRAISEGRHREGILELTSRARYSTLAEGAAGLVLSGVTTASEAVRVLNTTVD